MGGLLFKRRAALLTAAAAGVVLLGMTPFAASAATHLPEAVSFDAATAKPAAVTAKPAAVTVKPAAAPEFPARIAGTDRYGTAARLATEFGAASTVVIANGATDKQGFDALSANYLAAVVGAPILLTGAAALPATTGAAVEAVLKASGSTSLQVLVMGKSDSVSDAVVKQLNAIAQPIAKDQQNHVTRVAGNSRYDTAVQAATALGDNRSGALVGRYTVGSGSTLGKTAFLASGTSNADALAAGPVSGAMRIPVFLTGPSALPDSVATALASQGITNLIVLGGADRVPESVVAQAQSAGVSTTVRLAGSNRFDTAAKLYAFARGTLTGASGEHYGNSGKVPVFLGNGLTGFPDALAVGPLAAKNGAVLLTTSPGRLEAPARQFLAANRGSLSAVTALGSPATVSDAALAAAQAAAG